MDTPFYCPDSFYAVMQDREDGSPTLLDYNGKPVGLNVTAAMLFKSRDAAGRHAANFGGVVWRIESTLHAVE